MPEVIDGESNRVEPLEFYVFSDGMGINEIRFSPDVQFVMSTLLGVAVFVAGNLDGGVKTSKLLRELAEVAEKMEAVEDESTVQ